MQVESAEKKMKALNPFVVVETHKVRINPANAQALIRGYDVVLDGSDNALTRYLVNDACVLENVLLASAESPDQWRRCQMGRPADGLQHD
jgi:molybdopterin/thiamine biosynthesis adenylyltransferase